MKKLNEMQIGKRLTTAFRITTMITSIAAIAAIILNFKQIYVCIAVFWFPTG